MSDKVEEIPLSKIQWTHPIRPVNVDHVRNLCKSLRIHGQLQEIVVKPPNSDGVYEGVIGLHRYEGAKLAGPITVARDRALTPVRVALSVGSPTQKLTLTEMTENE